MKSFILILSLFFIAKTQDTTAAQYSINNLIEYLKKNGYYVILEEVKLNFGEDIAINMCSNLFKSFHCTDVVRNTMKTPNINAPLNKTLSKFLEERKYFSTLGKIQNYLSLIKAVELNMKRK